MGIIQKLRGTTVSTTVKGTTVQGVTVREVTAAGVTTGSAAEKSTTDLTAAQIKALYTTPLALVSAPGAGKIISVLNIVVKYVFGTTAFTGSNNLEFRYTSSNGAKVTADVDAALLLAASGTNYRSVAGVVTELTPVANAPIVVNVPTANPAQGLGTASITVYYRTLTP
jgi:hypothetical protein